MINRSNYKNFMEIMPQRTSHSKTFYMGDGRYKLVSSRTPIHKEVDGDWRDVSLRPVKVVGGWVIDGADWVAEIQTDPLQVTVKSEGQKFQSRSSDDPDTSRPKIEENRIEFIEAFPDTDLILLARPRGVEWYKRIKSSRGKHEFRWKTSRPNSFFYHRLKPEGVDARGRKTVLKIVRSPKEDHVDVKETFTGRVAERKSRKTRILRSSRDVSYPVLIDVPDISISVGAGGDDAYQFGTNVYTTNTQMLIGRIGTPNMDIGLRFGGVNIPQGATIDSAQLKLRQRNYAGSPSGQIYGVDVDNLGSSPWSTIRGKTKTTSQVAFVNTTSSSFVTVTHSVTGPVQEIINRGGWSSGNGLGLIALNTGAAVPNSSYVAAYEHATEAAPLLEIDYTASGSPYTLTCDTGAFTATGVAATLAQGRVASADSASFAVTGVDVGLSYGVMLACGTGAFTATGIDVSLIKDSVLSIETASFAVTGIEVDLAKSTTLSLDAGAFSLTGTDASLFKGYTLDSAAGAFTLTGVAVDFSVALTLATESATFTLSGVDVGLMKTSILSVSAASFTFTGVAATLARSEKQIPADTAEFILTGSFTGLSTTGDINLYPSGPRIDRFDTVF